MPLFQIHELITRRGERIEMRVAEDGRSACPVCGGLFAGELPWDYYWSCDEQGNKTGEPYAAASFDICPCCNTQYGLDDYVKSSEDMTQQQKWAELRREWLQRVPHTPEVVEQLQNLGIHIDDSKHRIG
jgi:hypothetical protein